MAALGVSLLALSGGCLEPSGPDADRVHEVRAIPPEAPDAAPLLLTGEERAWLRAHPVIRVAQDPGWPPIEFADGKGDPSGIAEDHLRLVERRPGVTFEKDRLILARILQKALDPIPEAERAAIYQKWVPIRYEYAFSFRRLWLPLAAFGLLLAGLIAWNRILLREIRTRKGAEGALKASEERFKSVMDNLPIGIAVNSVDPVVAFKYMNENFPRFYRTTREALADPDAFWEAVYEDPEFRKKIRAEVLEATSSGDPARMHWDDVPVARRGEPTTYIMAKNMPMPDQGLMISTVWDVTERKTAEEALRRALERLRRFVDANVVGVAVAEVSGGILEANDYYLRTIGYSRAEFEQGRVDWRALTPPEWLPADERAIKELFERGTCTPYEKEYLRRDGTRVPVYLSDAMLPGPEKQIAAFVLDITERKRAEEELFRRMDELQRFHELTVGREARMVELKKEINALLRKAGLPERYRILE